MAGIAVVLTQPAGRARRTRAALAAAGYQVVDWPLLRTVPEPDLDWRGLVARLAGCRWVVLPSPAAIDVVMAQAAASGLAWPSGVGIAVVGPGSAAALAAWHASVAGLADAPLLLPEGEPWDAAHLLAHPSLARPAGARIAVLRRADGRSDWIDALRARGARVEAHTVYRAGPLAPPDDGAAWLAGRARADAPVAFAVGSADVGRRLSDWIDGQPCARWALAQPVFAVHERVAEVLRARGWQRVLTHRPGAEGLLAGLESLRQERR